MQKKCCIICNKVCDKETRIIGGVICEKCMVRISKLDTSTFTYEVVKEKIKAKRI